MLDVHHHITRWSLFMGFSGKNLGAIHYSPAQNVRVLPTKLAAPLAVMLIARADIKGVGCWYDHIPSATLQYTGAVVWLDPIKFTYEDLTNIRGLPTWQAEPNNMKRALEALRSNLIEA
jgi:hypothetical protein